MIERHNCISVQVIQDVDVTVCFYFSFDVIKLFVSFILFFRLLVFRSLVLPPRARLGTIWWLNNETVYDVRSRVTEQTSQSGEGAWRYSRMPFVIALCISANNSSAAYYRPIHNQRSLTWVMPQNACLRSVVCFFLLIIYSCRSTVTRAKIWGKH